MNQNKIRKVITLIGINLIVLALLLLLVEVFFRCTSPLQNLPRNGISDGQHYTWGHHVINNRLGFREKEIAIPKPPGVFRIIILGDSLTWGAGLGINQRYSNLTEQYIRESYQGNKKIEVLNFGISGGPLIVYRDILVKIKHLLQPDLIVVGFCLNDPQPRKQDYSYEKEMIYRKSYFVFNFLAKYKTLAPYTSGRIEAAYWRSMEILGIIPTWWEALDRVYDTDSKEWKLFNEALIDIMNISDELGLHKPIFIVLNQGSSTTKPTDYNNPDDILKYFIRWYRQVESSAKKIGYRTINHEAEFATSLTENVLAINELDGHPSAQQNIIYAQKLSSLILKEDLSEGVAPR